MSQKKLIWVAILLMGICVCSMIGLFALSQVEPEETIAQSQNEQEPEATLLPLATNTPVSVPIPPTDSPVSLAPSYKEICVNNMNEMTDAQWKQHRTTVEGTMIISWTGYVDDARAKLLGGYELLVDMDPPDELFSAYDIAFDITENEALSYLKDQEVTFSGKIDTVMNLIGSCEIRLKEVTVTK
jgi:hypothetical protein